MDAHPIVMPENAGSASEGGQINLLGIMFRIGPDDTIDADMKRSWSTRTFLPGSHFSIGTHRGTKWRFDVRPNGTVSKLTRTQGGASWECISLDAMFASGSDEDFSKEARDLLTRTGVRDLIGEQVAETRGSEQGAEGGESCASGGAPKSGQKAGTDVVSIEGLRLSDGICFKIGGAKPSVVNLRNTQVSGRSRMSV